MTRTALLAVAVLALAPAAHAQRLSTITGAKLLSICTGTASSSCEAYLTGVADTVAASDKTTGQSPHAFGVCIPKPVTGVQLRQAVVAWLKSHSDDASKNAVQVTLRAFKAGYACDSSAG